MEAKHTPGPWKVCGDGVNVHAPESDTAITNLRHLCAPTVSEAEANAALIAAAPDMYAVLRDARGALIHAESLVDGWTEELDMVQDAIDAALAKAEGR